MNNAGISLCARGLIYLARCAVQGEKPERDKLERLDMQQLRSFAEAHSMVVIAAYALEGCLPEQEFASWKNARDREIRRSLLLSVEGKHLCAVMEQKGIWHMPLKGSIMKDLYPRSDMRQMTDQDILFDSSRREEMREYMLARGYEPKGYHDTHHDIYHKSPVYNIELHHTLFERNCALELVDYYQDVRQRMIPDAPGSYGYHFSDEDFYLYMVAHAYKHYQDHGVGVRSFLDMYIFWREKPELDWAYVRAEAEKMGMAEYERQALDLAQKLFGKERQPLTQAQKEMLGFCCISGTHGSEKAAIDHELGRAGADGNTGWRMKLRYLLRRLFPSLEWMKSRNKVLRKHPWLLPFVWIQRLFRGLFKKGKHTSDELRYVMGQDKQ